MNWMKKIIVGVLIATMFIGVLPMGAYAHEGMDPVWEEGRDYPVYTGQCGDNITWEYDSLYRSLEINGSGEMWDYSSHSSPWGKYCINSVSISPQVTSIGAYAFYDSCVPSISLPEGIVKIGEGAFKCCDFTYVSLPKSLETIGNEAFALCEDLVVYNDSYLPLSKATEGEYGSVADFAKTIYCTRGKWENMEWYIDEIDSDWYGISECVLHITGEGPMEDYEEGAVPWGNLKGAIHSVEIEDGITTIGANAFAGYTIRSISSAYREYVNWKPGTGEDVLHITLPESVTTIGANAFASCSIQTVTLPDSVTTIGANAFAGCSIQTVTLPDSVTTIGANAFAECEIQSLMLPSNIKTIEDNAFGTVKTIVNRSNLPLVKGESSYGGIAKNAEVVYQTNAPMPVSLSNDISLAEAFFEEEINISTNAEQKNLAVVLNGKLLILDEDYEVWYYNNTSTGTAKMLVIGIGDYTGYIEKTFEITGVYHISCGESIEICDKDAVQLDFDEKYSKADLYYDFEYINTISSPEVDVDEYFSVPYSYEVLNDSGMGYYKIVSTGTGGSAGWEMVWNGSYYVQRWVDNTYPIETTTAITSYHSPVLKVSWSENRITQGNTIFMQPEIYPKYSYDQELTWKSSDESVFTVDSFGVVTVVSSGKATLSVTAANGVGTEMELDISPMNLRDMYSTMTCEKEEDGTYSIGIRNYYGKLTENVDYTMTYEVNDNMVYAKFTGMGLYEGEIIKCFDLDINIERRSVCYGDATADGKSDAKDALIVLKSVVGKVKLDLRQQLLLEVNLDDKIDAKDALLILCYAVGKIDYYPAKAQYW